MKALEVRKYGCSFNHSKGQAFHNAHSTKKNTDKHRKSPQHSQTESFIIGMQTADFGCQSSTMIDFQEPPTDVDV